MDSRKCDDTPGFETLGLMIDCSRNAVMRAGAVKRMIDLMAKMGYNTLMLYTEDTYEVTGQPYFGHLRGRYTKEELRDIDGYAAKKGISLIPCIQTLAHLKTLMRWPQYRSIRDCDDILCVGEEKVYELIDDMFASISECFTSRTINVGMDEAYLLGRGAYMQKNGYRDRMEILLEHINRVSEIAARYGFTVLMWSDMFLRIAAEKGSADAAGLIPSNVRLIHWDYYSMKEREYDADLEKNLSLQKDIWFASGAWTWGGFTPHLKFSLNASIPAVKSCISHGVKHLLVTAWGDDGGECSRFSALPVIYAMSRYARGIFDEEAIKAGFESVVGIPWDDFMLLSLPDTLNTEAEDENSCPKTPFSGRNKPNNPDKYLLYNDCLTGFYDGWTRPSDGKAYAACAEKLKKFENNSEYGELFAVTSRLCETLSVKVNIGNETRAAYREGRSAVRKMLPAYRDLCVKIETLYETFEHWWMRENKPQGFEVQDIRFGGLLQRVKHAMRRLTMYADGELDRLEELEEPVLDPLGRDKEPKNASGEARDASRAKDGGTREQLYVAHWRDMVSASPL